MRIWRLSEAAVLKALAVIVLGKAGFSDTQIALVLGGLSTRHVRRLRRQFFREQKQDRPT